MNSPQLSQMRSSSPPEIKSLLTGGNSQKSFVVLLVLCLLFGGLGAHRFYSGKWKTALLQIVTFGGLGIWVLVDILMIAMGKFTDGEGKTVKARN